MEFTDYPVSSPAIQFPLTHKSLQLAACVSSDNSNIRVDIGTTALLSVDGDWGSMSTALPLPDSQVPVTASFELPRSIMRQLHSKLTADAKCVHQDDRLQIMQGEMHLQITAPALAPRDAEDVRDGSAPCSSSSLRVGLDQTLAFAKKARPDDEISSIFVDKDMIVANKPRLGATVAVMRGEASLSIALPVTNARRLRSCTAFMASTLAVEVVDGHLMVRDPETTLKLQLGTEQIPPIKRLLRQIPETIAEVPVAQLRSSSLFHNLLLQNKSDQERGTLRFSQDAGSSEIQIRGRHQFIPGRRSHEVLPSTPVDAGWAVEVDLDGLQGILLMEATTTVKIGRTQAGQLYIGQRTEACDAHTFLLPTTVTE